MSATFSIKINGIRTGTVGGLENVVKHVAFAVVGTESGQTFELPTQIEIANPDPAIFIQLPDVTEADVIRWVEENFQGMQGMQDHVQRVLDEQVARAAFQESAMPWNPPAQGPVMP